MVKRHEILADALGELHRLQSTGRHVFQSNEFTGTHKDRLLKTGFLLEIRRGWVVSSSPGTQPGESTPWFASFWEFCARYCNERFGEAWHLSAEQSLLLHAENTIVPDQVVVYAPKGANNRVELLFQTSIYDVKETTPPDPSDIVVRDGLRLYNPSAALIKVPDSFYHRNSLEAQVALGSFRDAGDILRRLLEGEHTIVAGRLVGAFRRFHQPEIADQILKTMRGAGHEIRPYDPFKPNQIIVSTQSVSAPVVGRLNTIWQTHRDQIIKIFPASPGLPPDTKNYLISIDDVYKSDAYHSLSIEGYRVSPEIVENVRMGNWDPDGHDGDRKDLNAFAARGYYLAFQQVKSSVEEIISGNNAGRITRHALQEWYQNLFQPCVDAHLIPITGLVGYRNDAVYLRTSRYVPPRWETVRDAMPALFDLLENEPDAGVRAVLGHWLFGYIHPYPDGNGRMARFLMNAMLASGGFPWTVIRVEDRREYLEAMDRASIGMDIGPFAEFIAVRVRKAMAAGGGDKTAG